jgi:hypothetical protein
MTPKLNLKVKVVRTVFKKKDLVESNFSKIILNGTFMDKNLNFLRSSVVKTELQS